MLTDEQIEKLKEAYKKDFKEELGEGEAREMAARLLELYQLLLEPTLEEQKAIDLLNKRKRSF